MEIDQIKAELSIQTVLNNYNLPPDRNSRLCCPWHNDKTPSLQIYPKTNTWTCFSSNCNAGSGDQIEMIQRMEGCTKHEAIMKAKEMLGIKTESGLDQIPILTKYYQNSLHAMDRSTKGQSYAASRGLDHQKLNIGYCGYAVGKTWNETLKKNAEKIGLFKIKNCIIFPTKNKDGQIVSIYGRSVSANPKVRHFYLSGGFKGLYPGYPNSETKALILTESIIDAATIMQHLDTPVLALYGTNGMTDEHTEAVSQLQDLQEVILFFDGDEAGQAAREKYYKQLKELRPDVKQSYVDTPEREDANSLIISHEPEILNHLIDNRLFFSIENKNKSKPKSSQRGKLNTDNPELILYETDLLHITILGGIKITGLDRLRVTLKIEKKEYSHHLPVRHSLDLYHSKQVEQLAQKMAESLEIGTAESERTLSHLTGALEQYRQEKLELLKPKKAEIKLMTEEERMEAIKYLKDPKLLRNTLQDITKSGIVGETNNSLIAYLAYTSRNREKPLHIMCLGASGTGKTYLQEKVSELIPEEDKIEITSLSDNALYYFGRDELKHKLLLIEDLDGAQNAEYPLRELQSKRSIGKTVTLKDNKGNLKTVSLRVNGPVCISGCTTKEKIYEDNANRCILLYIDDSSEQDKRIMNYQKKASAGSINGLEESGITEKLKNVQRLLRPIKVVNPYAEMIDLPQGVFKPRRTLLLLLSFIETITFYHQWQRPQRINETTKQPYVESIKEDIQAAFSLMKEVLFCKSDELSNASRSFLERLKNHIKDGQVFYTQEVRKQLRVSSSTIHRYVRELKQNGYIIYKGGNKFRGYEYEITDYQEYKKLKDGIDQKLSEILSKIDSIPVSQSYPTSENGISNDQTINALT
jgi:DNA primase/DNA-binding MarR family transcriptional regulator